MSMPKHVDAPAAAPPQHFRPNMASAGVGLHAWPPVGSPSNIHGRGRHQQQSYYDDSVNSLSFGFLATAILVSMFLVMAVFEKFLRPSQPPQVEPRDVESPDRGKPRCIPSPKMKVYDSGVSVLMPGDQVPSFIAHPAPISCPPERHPQPTHQQTTPCQHPISNSSLTSSHSH